MTHVTKFRSWVTELNVFTDEKDESPMLLEKQRVSTRIFLVLITSKDAYDVRRQIRALSMSLTFSFIYDADHT